MRQQAARQCLGNLVGAQTRALRSAWNLSTKNLSAKTRDLRSAWNLSTKNLSAKTRDLRSAPSRLGVKLLRRARRPLQLGISQLRPVGMKTGK